MAETVSRGVDVVKQKQVTVLFCVQVPRKECTRKRPVCQVAKLLNRAEQSLQDSKEAAFKTAIHCYISCLLLSLCVSITFIQTSQHSLKAKLFPLGLNLRRLPVCSLRYTITSLLYRKLLIWTTTDI